MRILRVVGSGLLPCGCFIGHYETYGGPTVQIVEERGVSCGDPAHQPGGRVTLPDADVSGSPAASGGHRSAA